MATDGEATESGCPRSRPGCHLIKWGSNFGKFNQQKLEMCSKSECWGPSYGFNFELNHKTKERMSENDNTCDVWKNYCRPIFFLVKILWERSTFWRWRAGNSPKTLLVLPFFPGNSWVPSEQTLQPEIASWKHDEAWILQNKGKEPGKG